MRGVALALAMVAALACAAAAAPWDATRKGVIDPLNTAFHRHWPTHLRTRDLAALRTLYATETGSGLAWDAARPVDAGGEEEILRWDGPPREEPIAARYEALLALFATRNSLFRGRPDGRLDLDAGRRHELAETP